MLTRLTAFLTTIAIVLASFMTPQLAYADGNTVLAGKWLPATETEMDQAKGGKLPFIVVIEVAGKVYYKLCPRTSSVTTCLKSYGLTAWKVVTTISDFISVTEGIAAVRSYICRRYGKMC